MSFERWVEEAEKESNEAWDKKFKERRSGMPSNYHEKIFQYYLSYKQFQITKWLVISTLFLALATIILSVLTLFYK